MSHKQDQIVHDTVKFLLIEFLLDMISGEIDGIGV